MARRDSRHQSSNADTFNTSRTPQQRRNLSSDTPTSEPETFSSDKENRSASKHPPKHIGKRHSGTAPMSEHGDTPESSRGKRQKLDHRIRAQPSQAAYRRELKERVDTTYYDPDQNEVERRATKKSLRDLVSRVNDSRTELLQSGSAGIEKTLAEADEIYKNVKQTSVATIDSKLLVTVGDLAYKKVNTLTLGDSSIGVDVDDFVSRCIAFMKEGDRAGAISEDARSGPSQRRQRRRNAEVEEDDEDDAEPLNWAHLGKNACFLFNRRPCLSGFLLGPLSVQKKARQQSQRRAKDASATETQTTRPHELDAADLEKEESASLTVICREIARLLDKFVKQAEQKVEQEFTETMSASEPSDEDMRRLFHKHGITDNGCVPLFNFCVNPRSFGQTVENMFYVSFLIKEGKVGLDFDSHGLPTVGIADQKSMAERQEAQRNQAVFTLDFDIWRELVDAYGIEKCVIPHREEEEWDDGTLQQQQQQRRRRRSTPQHIDDDEDSDDISDIDFDGGGGGGVDHVDGIGIDIDNVDDDVDDDDEDS